MYILNFQYVAPEIFFGWVGQVRGMGGGEAQSKRIKVRFSCSSNDKKMIILFRCMRRAKFKPSTRLFISVYTSTLSLYTHTQYLY